MVFQPNFHFFHQIVGRRRVSRFFAPNKANFKRSSSIVLCQQRLRPLQFCLLSIQIKAGSGGECQEEQDDIGRLDRASFNGV